MRRDFLSLKWQVAISVSLILIAGIGLITYLGKKNQEHTFVHERERALSHRQNAINAALNSIQTELSKLTAHLQSQAKKLKPGLYPGSAFDQALHNNWQELNLEWGLDAVVVYNPNGNIRLQLGKSTINGLIPQQWLTETLLTQSTSHKVLCRYSCWQVLASPIKAHEGPYGSVVLMKSVANTILDLHNEGSTELGILIPHNANEQDEEANINQLPNWKRRIIALTGGLKSRHTLKRLNELHDWKNISKEGPAFSFLHQNTEVSIIHLSQPFSESEASVVVLDDLSNEIKELNATLQTLFLAALVIFIFAEIALLWILWRPMNQLRKVAQVLPDLARGGNNRANILPKPAPSSRYLRNEIHDLQDSSFALAQRLSELDAQVDIRNQGLRERSQELLAERNFATALINNVQAVIITQGVNGDIDLINNEGRLLLGIPVQMETNKQAPLNFFNEFNVDKDSSVHQGLAALISQEMADFQHEGDVELYGQSYYLQWQHNLLPDNDQMILSVGIDLSRHKAAEDKLAWLADHDHLTKLFNRRHFQREFESALEESHQEQRSGALFFFDIDQFKLVNDTSGHPAGDRLLCEIANRISLGIRNVDIFSRLGGDEFGLLVKEIDEVGMLDIAQKLCDIAGNIEINLDNIRHKISISVGIVQFPAHGHRVDELMANVDLAMYRAKTLNNGRSNWEVFSASKSDKGELVNTVDWRSRIRNALDKDKFILHYQPIFDISKGRIAHYEALLRMTDDDGSIIPPGRFIPIAEQSGLIMDIDQYVIERAMEDLKYFINTGRDIHIAINVSAKALANGDFAQRLTETKKDYPSLSKNIIFELTETAAIEDIKATADIIHRCKQMGYQFSIDDFGIGYSSWMYLRELPVDYVKIDGAFVRNLANSREDYLFVKAINDVAHGLGKKTVAEFVEDSESLRLITELGVDYAQGYFIGKPSDQIFNEKLDLRFKPQERITKLNVRPTKAPSKPTINPKP